jgi:hypothetical protein
MKWNVFGDVVDDNGMIRIFSSMGTGDADVTAAHFMPSGGLKLRKLGFELLGLFSSWGCFQDEGIRRSTMEFLG